MHVLRAMPFRVASECGVGHMMMMMMINRSLKSSSDMAARQTPET
jgi:hypothetical protein